MGAEAQQGIMMRAALVAMLLVLPAAVAYSSGSTSAYASGKSSAYASGASAYASASKAAPLPSRRNNNNPSCQGHSHTSGCHCSGFQRKHCSWQEGPPCFPDNCCKSVEDLWKRI